MPSSSEPAPSRGEVTRQKIVDAAVRVFGDKGFDAASTREIAREAGLEQGLLTYHFKSKDALWRASAEAVFANLTGEISEHLAGRSGVADDETARTLLRLYVRTMAAHPEFFRFIVDQGHRFDARTTWLVDTLVKPRFEMIRRAGVFERAGFRDEEVPHALFGLIGAATLIFAVPANCKRLTGADPRKAATIEAHADFVADLFLRRR